MATATILANQDKDDDDVVVIVDPPTLPQPEQQRPEVEVVGFIKTFLHAFRLYSNYLIKLILKCRERKGTKCTFKQLISFYVDCNI